ncbi:MAG: Ig-like domain-containing protein [Anaerolineae bacterium]|nr:Ig-like domain-containing protein [Anaerolineae bacterium]
MNGMKRVVVLWTLIALLVGACGTPAVPTPTPSVPPPQPTATLRPPTPAPPTATPLPLPAPRLYQAPAGEVALDAPIEITFDQPMDQESVEAAFSISPAVEGTLEWADARTLLFVPERGDGGLERATRYRVTIGDEALNAEGTALQELAQFEFETVGELAVTQVMPAPGAKGLDPDSVVTVVFNRPVVPLTTISRQGELPDPLTFVPPVRGEGEWLNTSIYLFRPEDGFLPSTRYKARVAAGLTDATGAVLEEDYTWEFETILPAVTHLWPPGNFQHMGPTEVISVTFNQPMDHASVEAHFTLVAVDNGSSEPLAGRFRWSGGQTPTWPETIVFQPAKPLPRDTHFEVRVAEGAMAATHGAGLSGDHEWGFRTVRHAGIVSTSPSDAARDLDPGRYVEIDFASPMQVEGFLDHVSIRPAVTEVYTYWSNYDTEVKIYFEQEPQTQYQVTLDASTPDRYGETLGQAARVRFTTGDLKPYARLQTVGRVGTYSTYTDTVVYASYRNVTTLDLSLYRVDVVDFVRMNNDWEAMNVYGPSRGELVRRWSHQVGGDRNVVHLARFELTLDGGDALPPGVYFLQLDAPQVEAAYPRSYEPSRFLFAKSALNLTLKQARGEALVWATDLATGAPMAGLPVSFYTTWGDADASATTGADGVALVEGLDEQNLWDSFFAVSGRPGEETFAVVYNGWDQGISPWDYDVESEFWATRYQAYMYTDRPIYRPGQTVYFKGILRADDDANYRVPEDLERVTVQVYDPQGKELYTEALALNDMGTLHDELVLDAEAALGSYWVQIQEPEHELYAGTTFQVAEYRAPEFQVAVQTAQDAYLAGETIQAAAEATYYFGGPVAGAGVQWSALSSDYYFRYTCPQGESCPYYRWSDYEWGDWGWEEYGSYGGLVAQGEAETGDDGRVTLRVPTDLSEETQSQIYTIEASVTDINGQQVSNRTAAVVHKGEFYVGVAPRGYLAEAGEEKEVDLLAVDWDGEPVAGTELTVVFMEHNWFSTRREAEDGQFYWEWIARDEPVFTTTATTRTDGKAVAEFTPRKAGSYRVRAIGVDRHNHEIRSSAYFWVWGGSEVVSWRRESNNRIELIADQDEYEVGDVAEVLVPSPFTGTVQALVTVERGHILDVDVIEIEGNSSVLRVPIVEAHVPNVFVSVVLVQGADQGPGDLASQGLADFKMGLVKLPVSLETKELDITLTPDKAMEEDEHYGPRQTAVYDVLVTDHAGEPVKAELSLRLADLAVLALADEPGETLLNTFWRGRGLGVKTSLPLVVAMEPYNQEVRAQAKGGGGGEDGGLVRSRFADTAFWAPVVRTDEEGRAQVEVALPDNLTTWRMQARGITAETLVGRAEVDVLSTLDLLVRPVLPRFFVVGDRAEIATVVHNNTAEPLDVRVNISAEGLRLPTETSREVRVPAGDKVRVDWPVEVLPGQEVSVRMWASAGDLYDGREDALPVYRYVTPEVMATAGRLSGPEMRQEVVQLSPAVDAQQGELTVRIEGSLTAAAGEALDYLTHYPYECTEQTVSRFLPNVLTWQALDEFEGIEIEGQDRDALRQQLAQMVGIALQRLYANQHYDGGWGWWVNDESNTYLTAYALHGLTEAQRAGFTVDADAMERGAAFLRQNLPSVGRVGKSWEANRLAYALYVLAEYNSLAGDSASSSSRGGQGELGVAIRLFEKRDLLSRYGQATLAVALSLLEPDEQERVDTLLSDLAGDAVMSATGAHWEEGEPDYWNMNTDIRTTAIVVWALSRLDPESELLPGAVRWLMAVRRDGHWESTQETAWALMGLVEYMRASGELDGDYSYTVSLNGQELASGDVTAQNLSEGRDLRIDIARLLEEEANRLVIERLEPAAGQTGEGQLYYSASLRYTLPADHVQALERGIMVARQYTPERYSGTPERYSGTPASTTGDEPTRYVDTARVGDVIQVKLTIVAPDDLYYVVVEDPLPAGFEGVDMSLNTTSVVGEAPELRNLTAEEESTWYRRYGWGWWWFSHTEMRDEKVVLFANYLPRGTYEYTYLMRAGVAGEFYVLPSTAYQMYFPEVFGRSDGGKFTVTGE